jgi:hypothetical protein
MDQGANLQKTEDKGQREEGRGKRAEGRIQMTENRGKMKGDRCGKAEYLAFVEYFNI